MTWTKLSDDFSDDCWRLSDAAWRLHVEGLLWSNRKLVELVLLKEEMRLWAKRPDAAQELVDCGWWEDHGDRYIIVHHACYQRSREAVLNQQAANRRNGKKGGRPSREQVADLYPTEPPETESVSEPQTERDRTGLDGSGHLQGESSFSELPLAAGAEWPVWRGAGPDPFKEYN